MRFDLPDGLRLVHEMRIPVRWGDLDAMGHVNNTVYLRYFETLRIDWLRGFEAEPNPRGVGPVMANGFVNFLLELVVSAAKVKERNALRHRLFVRGRAVADLRAFCGLRNM